MSRSTAHLLRSKVGYLTGGNHYMETYLSFRVRASACSRVAKMSNALTSSVSEHSRALKLEIPPTIYPRRSGILAPSLNTLAASPFPLH